MRRRANPLDSKSYVNVYCNDVRLISWCMSGCCSISCSVLRYYYAIKMRSNWFDILTGSIKTWNQSGTASMQWNVCVWTPLLIGHYFELKYLWVWFKVWQHWQYNEWHLIWHEAYNTGPGGICHDRSIWLTIFAVNTSSPSLKFVLRDLYIHKDFVWELLDRNFRIGWFIRLCMEIHSISQKYMILLWMMK